METRPESLDKPKTIQKAMQIAQGLINLLIQGKLNNTTNDKISARIFAQLNDNPNIDWTVVIQTLIHKKEQIGPEQEDFHARMEGIIQGLSALSNTPIPAAQNTKSQTQDTKSQILRVVKDPEIIRLSNKLKDILTTFLTDKINKGELQSKPAKMLAINCCLFIKENPEFYGKDVAKLISKLSEDIVGKYPDNTDLVINFLTELRNRLIQNPIRYKATTPANLTKGGSFPASTPAPKPAPAPAPVPVAKPRPAPAKPISREKTPQTIIDIVKTIFKDIDFNNLGPKPNQYLASIVAQRLEANENLDLSQAINIIDFHKNEIPNANFVPSWPAFIYELDLFLKKKGRNSGGHTYIK